MNLADPNIRPTWEDAPKKRLYLPRRINVDKELVALARPAIDRYRRATYPQRHKRAKLLRLAKGLYAAVEKHRPHFVAEAAERDRKRFRQASLQHYKPRDPMLMSMVSMALGGMMLLTKMFRVRP